MRYVGLLLCFLSFCAHTRETEMLILRGRVPASVGSVVIDEDSGLLEISTNTSKEKYQVKVMHGDSYRYVDIIFN